MQSTDIADYLPLGGDVEGNCTVAAFGLKACKFVGSCARREHTLQSLLLVRVACGHNALNSGIDKSLQSVLRVGVVVLSGQNISIVEVALFVGHNGYTSSGGAEFCNLKAKSRAHLSLGVALLPLDLDTAAVKYCRHTYI